MTNQIQSKHESFAALYTTSVQHLVILHRVLYGTIAKKEALAYLHGHLREDADLADMGRLLKYQYQANKQSNPGPIEHLAKAGIIE